MTADDSADESTTYSAENLDRGDFVTILKGLGVSKPDSNKIKADYGTWNMLHYCSQA